MNKKDKIISKLILAVGIFLRTIACIQATPRENQHDVIYNCSHLDYAKYIYINGKLPNSNYREYAQPPINAFLQATFMKTISLLSNARRGYVALYTYCKWLTLIYSIITLILIYKIIKEFKLEKPYENIIFAIMAFYPGLITMTTQYSNDCISYMFFYLSLYLGIKWCKNKKLSTIILLALSIGIGMLTKISVGLIAFILGPMMLIIFISSLTKKDKMLSENIKPNITVQILIFALIVFPLGLSYSIRNFILFGQGFGEIFDVTKGSVLDLSLKNYTLVERYLSIPLHRFYDNVNYIFHDWIEYNIWVDLIKTSTFDEFHYRTRPYYPFLVVIYIINILFWLLSIIAIIYNVITTITKKIYYDKNVKELRNISFILFALAITAYLGFNIKYPRSCNSNYRYIAYITFAQATNIVIMFLNLNHTSRGRAPTRLF